jgi:uncharacterized damage-inducible protein DinB
MPISETLLPEFYQEMANTRKILELVPDDKADYKPHQKSMALGRLASHTAEIPSWVADTLQKELLELEAGYQPYLAKSRKELLEKFDKDVAEARKQLARATDEDLQKTWTMKFGGQTVMSMPRTAVLRGFIMNHLIHHRAQLGVYLRLNDIEFPGMYGPSADEMKFWDTAKA